MEGSLRHIPLKDLGDTVGAAPSGNLIESVRRTGVIQPIVLAETASEHGELTLRLIDGNRRLGAARKCGLPSIPAIVFSGVDEKSISTLTLVLNGFRTGNYLTEFWAIRQLERLHISESDIRSISGLTATKINQRKSLSDLRRELFVALRNGKMVQTHAITISRLPSENQQELAETFARNRRLLKSDIDRFIKRPNRRTPSSTPDPYPTSATTSWDIIGGHQESKPSHTSPVSVSDPQSSPPVTINRPDDVATEQMLRTDALPDPTPIEPQSLSMQAGSRLRTDAPPDPTPIEPQSLSMQAESRLRAAVAAAHMLDFSKDEFLDLASRIWDESLSKHSLDISTSHVLNSFSTNGSADRFPDLAAHKWDTGES